MTSSYWLRRPAAECMRGAKHSRGGIVLKWLKGYVVCRCHLWGTERFFNMCRHHGFYIWNIRVAEWTEFTMAASDFKKIKTLAKKTGVVPKIMRKAGLPFLMQHQKRHWTFYSGIGIYFLCLYVLSLFMWNITYQGQCHYSVNTLQRDLQSMQTVPGILRRNLKCDDIEKYIREKHPDISWVSAEEMGSTLKLSIKEGIPEEQDTVKQACHLCAPADGVVTELIIEQGTAFVQKGQRVKKGDRLISGVVETTDDGDVVVQKKGVESQGIVSLEVEEQVQFDIPVQYKKKDYEKKQVCRWTIQLKNKKYTIKNPLKWLDNSRNYDIIRSNYVNTVPVKWLDLPVISKVRYYPYQWISIMRSQEEIKKYGADRYQRQLRNITKRDDEILSSSAKIVKVDDKRWQLQGRIIYRTVAMVRVPVEESELQVDDSEGETHDRATVDS